MTIVGAQIFFTLCAMKWLERLLGIRRSMTFVQDTLSFAATQIGPGLHIRREETDGNDELGFRASQLRLTTPHTTSTVEGTTPILKLTTWKNGEEF